MIEFNVNFTVAVKLLDRGRETHAAHYKALGMKAPPITEDEDGWSEWQLWDLMHIFGITCFMGPPPPFETTIRLLTEEKDK